MSWSDRKLTPQPWHVGFGCIVAERCTDGALPNIGEMAYYGGELVCESISTQDAEFIMTAIRERAILLAAMKIIRHDGDEKSIMLAKEALTQCALGRAVMADDKVRTQLMRDFFQFAHYMEKYNRVLQLPETATRARIEPTGFAYWPSGCFVTDNIELRSVYPCGENFSGWDELAAMFALKFREHCLISLMKSAEYDETDIPF